MVVYVHHSSWSTTMTMYEVRAKKTIWAEGFTWLCTICYHYNFNNDLITQQPYAILIMYSESGGRFTAEYGRPKSAQREY